MSSKLEKLSGMLDKMLSNRGMGGKLKEYRIFGRWEKIVGKVIARHAQPVSLRGKKLYIMVDSSAWMQQISLLKPDIIEKANQNIGRGAIQDITLRLGEVALSAQSSDEQPKNEGLSPDEQRRIEDVVKAVKDPDIRESLRHVMQMDFLRRKK